MPRGLLRSVWGGSFSLIFIISIMSLMSLFIKKQAIICAFLCVLQAEKVHELNEEIGKLLAKAEQLGAEGNVDEAQKVLQEVEKVRIKKKDAEVRGELSVQTHTHTFFEP